MFAYCYTAVLALFYLLFLPLLPFLALKKKYRRSIWARFFLIGNPPFRKRAFHFHSCSLGETLALAPLVEKVDHANISVITQTGFEAAKRFENADIRYLPYEIFLWFWLTPQKALVVMEAELWYLLFYLSKKRGAKTFLVNARISDRSYPKYRRFRWFYKKVFEQIDHVFAQTKKDRERLLELGAKDVEVVGNIKLLNTPKVTRSYKKPERFLLLAASTHDPEEEIIATEWVMHMKDKSTLVVVPRHPERFDEVDELLVHIAKRENLRYHRFSQREDFSGDIVLVDRMGELVNIYPLADLVILGGSFCEVGGHNPLEPAYFHKPIISGKYIFNQIESYSYVEGIETIEASELGKRLEEGNFHPTKIVAHVDMEKIVRKLKNVV